MSQNTWGTYNTGLQSFEQFRRQYDLPLVWPAPVSHVTNFIAFLSINNKSSKTATCYIAAINFRCKLYSDINISDLFIVKKMLEGLKRSDARRDPRLPITREILGKILCKLPQICSSFYESALFAAGFSLAYYGYFRVGEITFTKPGQEHQIICTQDVKIIKNGNAKEVQIQLHFSKTDQGGRGTVIVIKDKESNTGPGLVSILEKYLRIRPKTLGPLLCHVNGKALTQYQFSSVLAKALTAAGIDARGYKSHSFRIGAASDASASGISDSEIQAKGRWKSQAYKSYIRI